MHLVRRRFLTGLAGAGATLLATPVAHSAARRPRPRSAIQHVVVVMMENRSFDHLLGWLPNADGAQAGLDVVTAGPVGRQVMRGMERPVRVRIGARWPCPATPAGNRAPRTRLRRARGQPSPAHDCWTAGQPSDPDGL